MGNLCSCLVTSPPIDQVCPTGNCLYVPSLLIHGSTSISNCGEQGFIDIVSKINTKLCDKHSLNRLIQVTKTSTNMTAYVNTSNQIVFQFINTTSNTGTIKYKVTCGKYSKSNIITVVARNMCYNVLCETGFTCNPCTGNCDVNGPGNLKIEALEPLITNNQSGLKFI